MPPRTLIAILLLASAAYAADGFVAIPGGLVRAGSPSSRVDDFEILDHAVTNAEYLAFVTATKASGLLHWVNGKFHDGLENLPIIFVNRYDVSKYQAWRSAAEKRVYRLPTASEFKYAQRGGTAKAVYP